MYFEYAVKASRVVKGKTKQVTEMLPIEAEDLIHAAMLGNAYMDNEGCDYTVTKVQAKSWIDVVNAPDKFSQDQEKASWWEDKVLYEDLEGNTKKETYLVWGVGNISVEEILLGRIGSGEVTNASEKQNYGEFIQEEVADEQLA